jgi:protein TonB
MKHVFFGLIILSAVGMSAFGQTPDRIIKGGILNGVATSLPKPPYPEEAKIAKFGGAVVIEVVIDEGGNVISAKRVTKPKPADEITESDRLQSLLEDAAESAALQARFSPTLRGGNPAKVSGQIVYDFVPGDPDDVLEGKRPISGGILNGKATSLPQPTYPPAAAAVRAEGMVTVQVTVDGNGNVIAAKAVSGHPLLQAAAVEAARRAEFPPTVLAGNPVKVSGVITYKFVLPKADNGQKP